MRCIHLAEEGLRGGRLEGGLVGLRRLDDAVRQRELDLLRVELNNVRPLALAGLELRGAQDLDAGRLGPAEARHVLVCAASGGAGWGHSTAAAAPHSCTPRPQLHL